MIFFRLQRRHGREEIISDREGGVRRLIYDDRGNVLHETGPDSRVIVRTFDERDNRLSGRTQLAQLPQPDLSLLTRPGRQFAYGVAQSALSATSAALHHLHQAAEAFADRGQNDRLAETCVALADAWARHGEWELVIPDFALQDLNPNSPTYQDTRSRDEFLGSVVVIYWAVAT